MASELLLMREKNSLVAVDALSSETLQEIAHGEVVNAKITRARNPKHHRLFFTLLQLVFENQTRYATVEQLLDAIKINIGLYDLYTLPGKIPIQIFRPRSISFASMCQKEFSEVYSKAVEWILSDLLPEVGSADLEQQVLEMVGERT